MQEATLESTPNNQAAATLQLDNHFVIKRDGSLVNFDQQKIAKAIVNAIQAADPSQPPTQTEQIAVKIADGIAEKFNKSFEPNSKINIEDIQDQVELGLMRQGLQKVARAYVLYREQRHVERQNNTVKKISADDEYAWVSILCLLYTSPSPRD